MCGEYYTITELSNRKFGIFVTAVRFNALNWKYPKTKAMTLNILNSRQIDDSFLLKIKIGEKQLQEVINELRIANVWWFFVKKFFMSFLVKISIEKRFEECCFNYDFVHVTT